MTEEWLEFRTAETVRVNLSDEVLAMRQERVKKRICLACGQPIVAGRVTRGNHHSCYSAQCRQVKAGSETWASLVRRGKALKKGKAGRRPSNPVSVEYASA